MKLERIYIKKSSGIGKLLVSLADGSFSGLAIVLFFVVVAFVVFCFIREMSLLFTNISDCFMQCARLGLNGLQGLISFAARRFGAGGELWSSDFVLCSAFY